MCSRHRTCFSKLGGLRNGFRCIGMTIALMRRSSWIVWIGFHFGTAILGWSRTWITTAAIMQMRLGFPWQMRTDMPHSIISTFSQNRNSPRLTRQKFYWFSATATMQQPHCLTAISHSFRTYCACRLLMQSFWRIICTRSVGFWVKLKSHPAWCSICAAAAIAVRVCRLQVQRKCVTRLSAGKTALSGSAKQLSLTVSAHFSIRISSVV